MSLMATSPDPAPTWQTNSLVHHVCQAANSNGLFSAVGHALGVSTNALAPAVSSLTVAPVEARTNATQLLFSMDAHGVPCRVWYTVVPLRDTVLLKVEDFSAEEIARAAQPGSVVDLPQVSVRSL